MRSPGARGTDCYAVRMSSRTNKLAVQAISFLASASTYVIMQASHAGAMYIAAVDTRSINESLLEHPAVF